MVGSIGRVGAAGDNAAMESFFSLLQKNALDRRSWTTREELRIAIVTWIERTYHRRRRQAALGRLTPVEFEIVMTTPALQAASPNLSPEPAPDPCRTNIGAVTEVMRLLAAGHRVALTRGGQTLTGLALAAQDLKEGRCTSHPELALFSSWGELQDYANFDPAGRDLQPFVELVDTHGSRAIIAAVDALADESTADVTVSTAHKAKGREWPQVRIADDFPEPPDTDQDDGCGRPIPEPVSETDARLAYVAVTRARHRLDLGGLSWIEHHPGPESPRAGGQRGQ